MKQQTTSSAASKVQILAMVSRLLSHYWLATEPEPVRRAQLEDWLEDLLEFGADAVADACREWRQQPGARRPLPGDIRKLCIEAQTAQRERLAHASYSDGDGYARSVGWASEAERRDAIRKDEAEREGRYERARLVREEMAATGRLGHRHASRAAAAALKANGVTVREEDPEELRKGRIALGIEEAEPPPTAMAAE